MTTQIAESIKKFFANQQWRYEYFEEDGLFESAVQLTEESGAMIHAIVGKAAFTVMIAPELAVEAERYDEVREFINDVNARMLLGGLVLDCEEGIVYFRVGQNCFGQTPSEEIVEDAFMYPISFVDDHFDTLADLFAGRISAEEALEQVFAQDQE